MINFTFESTDEINEESLMNMADEMASAATTFNDRGYDNFIQAREAFKTALHEFITKPS